VLVASGHPISAALRRRIGLFPDDFIPEIPPVRLKSKGCPPWDSDEVLRLQPEICFTTPIRVAQMQPERAVYLENPAHFMENPDKAANVFGWIPLLSDFLGTL
jgi:hypothetical protein